VIAVAAGLCLIVAIVFVVLWSRARAQFASARAARDNAERARGGLAALLETVPLTAFRWDRDGTEAPGRAGGFDRFLAGLDPADAPRIAAAIEGLRQRGTALDATIATPAGTAYTLEGRNTAHGETVLWLADDSPAHRAEASRAAVAALAGGLRETLDAIPVPVWRRNRDMVLIDCNAAYAAALDAPREVVLGEGRELASANARGKVVALAQAAAKGEPQSERRHVVIAGSRRLLAVTEMPDRDGGTIGFAIDRTDVETTESELSRHINAHGTVLENIHAAVAIYGKDKRLIFFNSAFAALWGVESDRLLGEPGLDEVLDLLRERRRLPELVDFRAFKRQQLGMFTSLIEPLQEMMHLPDGRTLGVSISPHPFGGLTFVYEDVTDRLALESSYNTLIEVQRETLDNLFEGIAVFGSDGRLKLHNPAYRTIWGLGGTDLAGEPHISEIVEKTRAFYAERGDWPAVREAVIARITDGAPTAGPLDRRDGSVLRIATVPLPDGNVLLTCLDVTDTARVERALRERNEALETAGQLKSEFIANVSYELRTPLNGIIGFAEILANQYFGTLNQRQLDYSRGILDSSHRLLSLINDILDLATIEAGYLVLETGPVDIHEMLQAIMTLTRERARNQDLDLALACPAGIGTIEADERRLKQALFNLISNAIKFTPPGGSIKVEARRDGGDLLLAVADTGVGIPSADRDRIFEKFERGNAQLPQSGAGLGLSLVKSLIELHGGTVEIDSAPGSGTIVTCRLPAVAPAVVPQAATD
jgi:signal transduction histidine kinase